MAYYHALCPSRQNPSRSLPGVRTFHSFSAGIFWCIIHLGCSPSRSDAKWAKWGESRETCHKHIQVIFQPTQKKNIQNDIICTKKMKPILSRVSCIVIFFDFHAIFHPNSYHHSHYCNANKRMIYCFKNKILISGFLQVDEYMVYLKCLKTFRRPSKQNLRNKLKWLNCKCLKILKSTHLLENQSDLKWKAWLKQE